MKYQELLVLLPCHSLEDFPTYQEGDDAQSLLAAWSALWHPELIAAAGQAPTWRRIEDPPPDVKNRLIVVPSMCVSRLPTGFAQRVKEDGGCLVRKTNSREEIITAALAPLEDRPPPVDAELAADFLAFGYCYLQVELLTRQMRYSSNLDEAYLKGAAVAAAQAAVAGNHELAKGKLAACFSVLAEERDRYYPVDAFILDLNLTASTTLGAALQVELSGPTPSNVLLSGSSLLRLQEKEPVTLEALRRATAENRLGLLGGELEETRLPLLGMETLGAELRRGIDGYQALLGRRPEVFARWRYGLTPTLPGILHQLGFRGALHATFEDGTVPTGSQFKVRWEGLDGVAIPAIARSPLDASKPQTFLSYALKMAESMDGDHVATVCLAHWPGQASPWLADLRRIAKYCSALGKFTTIHDYFSSGDLPGHLDRFEADRYHSPYLKQAVIRKQDDPLSTLIRYWRRQAQAGAVQTLRTLTTLVSGRLAPVGDVAPVGEADSGDISPAAITEQAEARPTDLQLEAALAAVGQAWANCLTQSVGPNTAPSPASIRPDQGCLVINPCSFVRRVLVETPHLSGLPAVAKPIYACGQAGETKQIVLDLPPLGFVWMSAGDAPQRAAKEQLLAETHLLRNEFFEAVINPTTGALSAIHEYHTRGNRLSQQIALRYPGASQKPGDTYRDPDETATYSVMAADSVETTIATTALGEIVVRGRLVDLHGEKLAAFQTTYRLWRGSRVLHLEIELNPVEEPKSDPWNSYYCCRFAWADENADLFRTINETRQPATAKRIEAPHYIEIATEKQSQTIFTAGLPFHRRHESRMIDTLLMTRGERCRKFQLGIGVDVPHPMLEAISLITPPVVIPNMPRPTTGASGWLFHLDSRNVIATNWAPLVEGGGVTGFQVRLLETAGRPVNLGLSAFRPIRAAEQVNLLGERVRDCALENGKIQINVSAHEWTQIVARW